MSRLKFSLECEGSLEIGPIFDCLNVSITQSPYHCTKDANANSSAIQ